MTDERTFGEKLSERVGYWQRVLRLQDWTVGITIARQSELQGAPPDTLASSTIYVHRKDAVIAVVHPFDASAASQYFVGNESMDYDITLVHELLRLHLLRLGEGEKPITSIGEEQTLHTLSRAMVSLYREAHPLKNADTPVPLSFSELGPVLPSPILTPSTVEAPQFGHYV